MTLRLTAHDIQVVLLDIEGTTTPIAFVHDVLFPFARTHLPDWLRQHADTPERFEIERLLKVEHDADADRGEGPPAWSEMADPSATTGLLRYVGWLMDRDRKSAGLKTLQGLIWEDGYMRGELHGVVYSDVAGALRRWRGAGVHTAIYSSGSELAQRRLFASIPDGDVTPLIAAFFDTRVGGKRDPASYARIASALGHDPAHMLFVSDVTAELQAAQQAGYLTALCLRPGNAPQADAACFTQIRSCDEIA